MGCATGMFGQYTEQDVAAEVASFTPRLPVAELMNGGIIKLPGANGFFNPNSLLDPSWLRGKMTIDEYRQAIDYINRCTAHAFVGLNKAYTVSEKPYRDSLRTQAGMAAVEEVNKRNRSVQFNYQETAASMQMSTTYSTDPAVQLANRKNGGVGRSQLVVLYITLK